MNTSHAFLGALLLLTSFTGTAKAADTPPVLDTQAQAFVNQTTVKGAKPIYEMPVADARQVLEKIQSGNISKAPADVTDTTLPVGVMPDISVRIYRPQGSKGVLPVVMYFHGGGWILGSKDTHDRLLRALTSQSGLAFVFVNYTPSPEAQFPVPLEQAYQATKYISEHGASLGLDSTRLAVAGDSVGGNMVAGVTILAKERSTPKIMFQALLYPVTDADMNTPSYTQFAEGPWLTKNAMAWFWEAYAPNLQDRNQITVSPLKASLDQLQGLPPALLITDENDVLRDEGEAYGRKLTQAGIVVSAIRFNQTMHDFMMLNPLSTSPAALTATAVTAQTLKMALSAPAK